MARFSKWLIFINSFLRIMGKGSDAVFLLVLQSRQQRKGRGTGGLAAGLSSKKFENKAGCYF